MDLFSRMAQGTVTDLSVFRAKRSQKDAQKEKPKEEPKQAEKQSDESLPITQQTQTPAHKKPEEKPKAVEQKEQTAEPEKKPSAVEQKKEEEPKTAEMTADDTAVPPDDQKTESVPVQSAAEETAAGKAEPEEDTPAAEAKPEEDAPAAEQKEEEKGRVIQFKQPENPNEEAAVKLEMELETAKTNLLPVFPIVRYLKNKCMSDDAFAAAVNDERKTLAKCFDFVTDEVKKALNDGRSGWLDDNEVYAYAETYYLTDEAVFEQIAAEKAEEERKRQEEVEQRRKEQEEKRKKAAAQRRKEKAAEKKKAAEEAKKAVEEAQKTEAPESESTEQTKQSEMQLCLEM